MEIDYKFYFVSFYIAAHVQAGIINELTGDRILGYVNENISLFDEQSSNA